MGVGKALVVALNIFCGIYGVYFIGIILLGACQRRRPQFPTAPPKKRIAALVAARNEEAVIEGVVRTLMGQNYPRELFDVWVVPNNCSDDTERVAREAGARILQCTDPVKSKGDVLRFAFSKLLAMGEYDGFCLFDADNIVDPGFLGVANSALCAGWRIAQGFRDSKNSRGSWVAGGMSVFYWFMSALFNRGRAALNMSAMLNGTGVMISSDLLEEVGWDTHTLTEDLEFTAQCGILGVKIGWMEDAITYDEQPDGFWCSITQRRRWFAGSVQCLRRYGPALWKQALVRGKFQALDFGLFFLGNLVQIISLIPGIAGILQAVRYGIEHRVLGLMAAAAAGALVLVFAASSALAALIVAMSGRHPRRELPGILGFWLILLSWGPANLSALIVPPKWKPIPHGSSADIPEARWVPRARKKPAPVSSEKAGGF